MVVFFTDLDNTMIYSYKHDIGKDKICAEIYQDREVSFITPKTAELLKEVNNKVILIPTTTRTIEQYERIDLGYGTPKYALVCNGGVLLVNGKEDINWYEDSLELIKDCQEQLKLAEELMTKDENRSFEVRNIRNLFIFTKSSEPLLSVERLSQRLDTDKVDVFSNGVKVYVVPKKLGKGDAVLRFILRLPKDKEYYTTVSAGDSEFDISMLKATDYSIAPKSLADTANLSNAFEVFDGNGVFSDLILSQVLLIQKFDTLF